MSFILFKPTNNHINLSQKLFELIELNIYEELYKFIFEL